MRKQHPLRDWVVEQIRAGRSDRSIHDQAGVNRKVIRSIRQETGVNVFSRTKSIEEQLTLYCVGPCPNGHVLWTGSVSSSGAPRIRINAREVPASHAIFEQRAGRSAVGHVRADCDVKHCVAPGHLMDDLERRKVRLQTRALLGYPDHWDFCETCSSSWEHEGRVEEKLSLYCRRCTTMRSQRNREKGTE